MNLEALSFFIEENNTKDEVTQKWIYLVKDFLLREQKKSWSGVNTQSIFQGWDFKKSLKKIILVDFCAKIYSNKELVLDFYDSLSKEEQAMLQHAVWFSTVSQKELEKIFGKGILLHVNRKISGWHNELEVKLIPELNNWMNFITIVKVHDYYLFDHQSTKMVSLLFEIPKSMAIALKVHLPKPDGYEIKGIDRLEKEGLALFNVEVDIFRELPIIIPYYLQHNIKYSKKGYPILSSTRKMSKSVKLMEFPGIEKEGYRSHLIAGVLSDNFKVKSPLHDSIEIIRALFKPERPDFSVFPLILTYLKGVNYFENYNFNNALFKNIIQFVTRLSKDQWVIFQNIKTHIKATGGFMPLGNYYIYNRLRAVDLDNEDVDLTLNNIGDYVETPALAGCFYLFAAYGLLELAIDPKDPNEFSPYDGLYAIKLTGLGAHVFGINPSYTPPEDDNQVQLLFDELSSSIRINGNLEIGEMMLKNYALKVSGNRYQFSNGLFLKDCNSTKSLENKIALFRQTIKQKLPDFWENYLNDLIENSKLLKGKNNVHVFSLPANNRDLLRVIAQDEVLRKLVIKAEQFHVIIENNNYNLFTNRMKELGYLIQ